MQVLTRPGAASHPYLVGTEDLIDPCQGGLLLIPFPDQAGQEIAHQLIDGRVAVERRLAGRAEEILVQGQGEVPLTRRTLPAVSPR